MKTFSISFQRTSKAEIAKAMRTNDAPVQIKALVHDAMAGYADDALVNVSLSGTLGDTGLSISGSVWG